MENNKTNQSQAGINEGCKCWMHGGTCCCGYGCGYGFGWGWHGAHHIGFMILRCLLAIVILVAVFWLGVKIGELKGAYGYGGGYPFGMHGHGQYGVMIGGGYYQPAPVLRTATSTQ